MTRCYRNPPLHLPYLSLQISLNHFKEVGSACCQFPGGSTDGPSRCCPSGCDTEVFGGSIYESCDSTGRVRFMLVLSQL